MSLCSHNNLLNHTRKKKPFHIQCESSVLRCDFNDYTTKTQYQFCNTDVPCTTVVENVMIA